MNVQIPQEVMSHFSDNPHPESAVICLQHLMDLWAHAMTAYAVAQHPELAARVDSRFQWKPSFEEAEYLNAMFILVTAEYSKHHPHEWFVEVLHTVDVYGNGNIYIPDDHEHVMEHLVAVRRANPDLHHSATPSKSVMH